MTECETLRTVETMGGHWDYTDRVNFRDRAAIAFMSAFITKAVFDIDETLCKKAYELADKMYKVRMETLPHCKEDDEPWD